GGRRRPWASRSRRHCFRGQIRSSSRRADLERARVAYRGPRESPTGLSLDSGCAEEGMGRCPVSGAGCGGGCWGGAVGRCCCGAEGIFTGCLPFGTTILPSSGAFGTWGAVGARAGAATGGGAGAVTGGVTAGGATAATVGTLRPVSWIITSPSTRCDDQPKPKPREAA